MPLSVLLTVSPPSVLLFAISPHHSLPPICHTHAQDREAVEVANLEERKLVLKFEADELDRTRDELVRSLEEKRKSQV